MMSVHESMRFTCERITQQRTHWDTSAVRHVLLSVWHTLWRLSGNSLQQHRNTFLLYFTRLSSSLQSRPTVKHKSRWQKWIHSKHTHTLVEALQSAMLHPKCVTLLQYKLYTVAVYDMKNVSFVSHWLKLLCWSFVMKNKVLHLRRK